MCMLNEFVFKVNYTGMILDKANDNMMTVMYFESIESHTI
jgi:hypothetical protein